MDSSFQTDPMASEKPDSTLHCGAKKNSELNVSGGARLDSERLHQLEEQFISDLKPHGVVQRLLVRQAALAAAFLEVAGDWEREVAGSLEQAGLNPWQPSPPTTPEEWGELSQQLLSSDALTKAGRYANLHFRRLTKALSELRKLQRRRTVQVLPDNKFTEQQCVAQLRQRFDAEDWRCPDCGHGRGDWLPSRSAWECRGCHRQVGLRVGTPMENSPLPLATWAHAFELLRFDPELPTATLGEALEIARPDTVRRLRQVLLPVLDDSAALGGLLP